MSTVPSSTGGWSVHPDRALPSDPHTRAVAREILAQTSTLPIVSMHGHVEASMLRDDEPFRDPTSLFVTPDHYLVRMLVSQGVDYDQLQDPDGDEREARRIWRLFCKGWRYFRGTPTRYWMEHVLSEVFELDDQLSAVTADAAYDHIAGRLAEDAYRPRALFDRFRIELLATTDAAQSDLAAHAALKDEGWGQRVIPTFRPDPLLVADAPGWQAELDTLAAASGVDTVGYDGFLDALRSRRHAFIAAGARATDHSHPVAEMTPLDDSEARRLFDAARAGDLGAAGARAFTSHMLFQMAAMSADDGLVMQIHHGVLRDHDRVTAARYGANIGLDIPTGVEFSRALRPALEAFGHRPGFRMVAFTIDETTYSRELAPLAGVYPALRLGAPWWFLDAPDAMRRFREASVETAGFYNTTGFVDDTRAFCSIPARHDLARRVDAGYLARLVAEHRLALDEAIDTARDLAYHLPKASYPPIPAGV